MARPFDENPIGSRYRERYGQYRQRWSTRKAARISYGTILPDGMTEVRTQLLASAVWPDGIDRIHDIAIYQIKFEDTGGNAFTGTARFMIRAPDLTMVYPFASYEDIVWGTWVYLGTLSSNIRVGEKYYVGIFSTDANDTGGNGRRAEFKVNIARFEP